ncbi:tyrosine-type recombinase/integrase [Polymorphospora sp. A560]|uniref:tyrosine-type recombinase/integrase n=1 Tax=Polymorphospora sp. A560 TaxID=3040203 RepID=UPI0038917445
MERQRSVGRAPRRQESDLAFTTRHGTPIEPRNFQRFWQSRCIKAGLRPITVHKARGTCATLLADLEVPLHRLRLTGNS